MLLHNPEKVCKDNEQNDNFEQIIKLAAQRANITKNASKIMKPSNTLFRLAHLCNGPLCEPWKASAGNFSEKKPFYRVAFHYIAFVYRPLFLTNPCSEC